MCIDVNQSVLDDVIIRNNFGSRMRFVMAKENVDERFAQRRSELWHIALMKALRLGKRI